MAGESGVTPIDRFDASKFPTRFGGQIRGFHAKGYIDDKSNRMLDDCLRYCIVAGKKALESADLGGKRLNKMNLLEKVWSILTQIEDLYLLMDPDDFLWLKNQLAIKASSDSELFCFRSRELVEVTKSSKDLRHSVPVVLEVEVDVDLSGGRGSERWT
ncbi:nematode resistance protein-like HSPRO2 [Salvia splendens]|uniref:nematode resistance protein-like HSPRO2 n=1 Tax=Salvia splendens TaxID=180675 RepID=UPI001C25DF4E|nr:nematode resistance protein-like HSPRO2 [Salvia splendens]